MTERHEMRVGIAGTFPGVRLITSVYEALEDHGYRAVFLGPISELPVDHFDAIIHVDPNGGAELIAQCANADIPGVTVNIIAAPHSWSVVCMNADIYGSGSGLLTTMIRGALRTGQLTLRGYPEDEVLPVEQEVAAELLVNALNNHFDNGPKTYKLIEDDSPAMTMGAAARVIFRTLQHYIYEAEEAGIRLHTPSLQVPECISSTPTKVISKDEYDPERYLFVEMGFALGVRTTIQRLIQSGDVPEIQDSTRYQIPPEVYQELTGQRGLVSKDDYLLHWDF